MSEDHESIEPAPRPQPEPRPAPAPPPHDRPLFPWVLSGIGILTLIGAAVMTRGGQGPAAEPVAAASSTADAAPATAEPPAPAPATRDDLEGLKAELQARIDAVTKTIEELPKPEPAPDLKPLEEKIAALAPVAEMAPTFNNKFADIQSNLDTLQTGLKAVTEKVEAMKDAAAAPASTETGTPAPAAAAATPAMPAPAPAPAPSQPAAEKPKIAGDEIQGVLGQFKQNQFQPARDELAKLRDQYPTDARVWYLSALATGFATGTWTGETTQLVTRAVELEKAGTPERAAIDAALEGLNPSATQWVGFYRQQAR